MKFLSWNCRGFGSNSKVEALKDLVKIEKPSVILLQETKMEDFLSIRTSQKISSNR
jgi:exonuclease III